jgi:multimeric flavodoxin WrbA
VIPLASKIYYVIGINASPRKNSNTEILMNQMMKGVKSQGVITEIVNLKDLHLKPCLACEGCRTTRTCRAHIDDMQILITKLKAAQGFILGSPMHNYNVTAIMKIFLDRMYPLHYFNPENRKERHSLLPQNKKVLIYTVCEQQDNKYVKMALDAMRLPLETLGCEVVSELTATGFFKAGEVLNDQEILDKAYTEGINLAKSLKK